MRSERLGATKTLLTFGRQIVVMDIWFRFLYLIWEILYTFWGFRRYETKKWGERVDSD
jgi:hypothetical protein